MTPTQKEIAVLEERMRLAELGTDAAFFEEVLADDVLLDSKEGPSFAKAQVVAAHRGPSKFTRVEMSDLKIQDHGTAAVVTCKGIYEGPQWSGTLRFMRVWLKKNDRWQIIAGYVQQA